MPKHTRRFEPDKPVIRCPQCHGTGARPGAFRAITESRDSAHPVDMRCSHCGGKGVINATPTTNGS